MAKCKCQPCHLFQFWSSHYKKLPTRPNLVAAKKDYVMYEERLKEMGFLSLTRRLRERGYLRGELKDYCYCRHTDIKGILMPSSI